MEALYIGLAWVLIINSSPGTSASTVITVPTETEELCEKARRTYVNNWVAVYGRAPSYTLMFCTQTRTLRSLPSGNTPK